MRGKKRQVIKKVRSALERSTAELDAVETMKRYERTKVALKTNIALDKMKITDLAKRRRVHRIIQDATKRVHMLKEWGKMPTGIASLKKGSSDLFMQECNEALLEELGDKNALRFSLKFFLSPVKLRPKKKKT